MSEYPQLHHLNWMLKDALRHACITARRCQEATEGTETTLLFNNAANAISDFIHNNPAILALDSAALKRLEPPA